MSARPLVNRNLNLYGTTRPGPRLSKCSTACAAAHVMAVNRASSSLCLKASQQRWPSFDHSLMKSFTSPRSTSKNVVYPWDAAPAHWFSPPASPPTFIDAAASSIRRP